jgi:hypothetical protein
MEKGKGLEKGEEMSGVAAWCFIYRMLGKCLGIIRLLKAALNCMALNGAPPTWRRWNEMLV